MKLDPEGEDSDLEEDWQSGLHNSHLEVTLETHEDEQLEISYGGGLEDSGEVDEETADFDSERLKQVRYVLVNFLGTIFRFKFGGYWI